jgi:hypothetical protein
MYIQVALVGGQSFPEIYLRSWKWGKGEFPEENPKLIL